LDFALHHRELDPEEQQYAIINSKGFGGNNASATLLSPSVTSRMLQARYSGEEWTAWQRANEQVQAQQRGYDDDMVSGKREPVYKFDHGVLLDGDVELGPGRMLVGGKVVDLDFESPYPDMRI
jgi:acetoacetyl-[acyl-carrier protein] synthase